MKELIHKYGTHELWNYDGQMIYHCAACHHQEPWDGGGPERWTSVSREPCEHCPEKDFGPSVNAKFLALVISEYVEHGVSLPELQELVANIYVGCIAGRDIGDKLVADLDPRPSAKA